MLALHELENRIRSIAAEIELALRPSNTPGLAGWGQFVDAQTHVHQIGSYGTSAAIATLLVADPTRAIDARVAAQVEEFWRAGGSAGVKLRSQNVRLAFLILCLARTIHPALATVRDEIVTELRQRQLPNGAWGDWHHPTEQTQARSETTAWVILGLNRLNPGDSHAVRGAEYILNELRGSAQTKRLSSIAVAATLTVLPQQSVKAELLDRASALVDEMQVTDQENISFFDYVLDNDGATRVARDYLCFPAFYPLTLLLKGLHERAAPYALPGVALRRSEVTVGLVTLVDNGRPYRLPGAKFAATVDQAMLALAYENLRDSRSKMDPFIAPLRPVREWARESWLTRVILPVALLIVAGVTLEDPTTLPEAIEKILSVKLTEAIAWANDNASLLRLASGLVLMVSAGVPFSVYRFIKRNLF